MKICIIAEGSYPYTVGGVSSWIDMLIRELPQHEFVLQTIAVSPEDRGNFKYHLPSTLTEVSEVFLMDKDVVKRKKKSLKMKPREKEAFESFVLGEHIQWEEIFKFFIKNDVSVNNLVMGEDFYDLVEKYCLVKYNRVVMTEFLWTYRSMLTPLCLLLKHRPPKADIYHSVSTGYAGIMGALSKYLYNKPLLLTEHGIYTRERMEDIIRADWTRGIYKDLWINHFYKLSDCTYDYSDEVVSLFEGARDIQIELGCPMEKTAVIPNGINIEGLSDLKQKEETDKSINLGIVARVAPIKDIKTLINAFSYAKKEMAALKLYIMGPCDEDEEYYKECTELIEMLEVKDIIFTGRVDVREYIGKMDISILTSISEGQPLSILEFMAAGKPCIATRVGCCDELINGLQPGDEPAGIVTPVLNASSIADAILTLAGDPKMCRQMGEVGRERVRKYYDKNRFIHAYDLLYKKLYHKEESDKE